MLLFEFQIMQHMWSSTNDTYDFRKDICHIFFWKVLVNVTLQLPSFILLRSLYKFHYTANGYRLSFRRIPFSQVKNEPIKMYNLPNRASYYRIFDDIKNCRSQKHAQQAILQITSSFLWKEKSKNTIFLNRISKFFQKHYNIRKMTDYIKCK